MLKRVIKRGINSFVYAAAINVIVFALLYLIHPDPDYIPMLPGFAQRFHSVGEALLVQIVLIGFSSASFGAGSVLMELERLSLLLQSILYFIVTSIVWIPVACFCWEIYRYPQAIVSFILSYTASYIISWVIQYKVCKASIEQINQKLAEMRLENQER